MTKNHFSCQGLMTPLDLNLKSPARITLIDCRFSSEKKYEFNELKESNQVKKNIPQ